MEKKSMKKSEIVRYGHILPRYGLYGISGYDVIVAGMECLWFKTRALASKWMEKNGYGVIG